MKIKPWERDGDGRWERSRGQTQTAADGWSRRRSHKANGAPGQREPLPGSGKSAYFLYEMPQPTARVSFTSTVSFASSALMASRTYFFDTLLSFWLSSIAPV